MDTTMSDRARWLTRAVATAVLLTFPLGGTACGAPAQEQPAPASPHPPAATSEAPAPASPSPPPVAATTLTELVEHPCTALDQRDADALGVVSVDEYADEKTGTMHCGWAAVVGLLSLESDPSQAQPRAAGLPNNTKLDVGGGQTMIKIDIGGYPALQVSLGTVCVAFVTTGPTQAFTFSAGSLRGEKGEDMCGVTRQFAAAVFAHQGPK